MAIVDVKNYSSPKVVERSGFEKIGTKMILNSWEKEEKTFYYYKYYRGNI